ncbi:MAG TPA: hypothetical protein VN445_00290 [Rectinemataceae bacterium]|nr:hypothetical protein [Rectinemataceae bacterium]
MKYLKVFALVLVVALVASCAAKLPQKEIDAANTAFSDAQTVKADVYAPTEFQTAQDAKNSLDTELAVQEALQSGKSYKQTTELAKALLDAATKAKDAATANVETVKTEVATLITDVQAAFATVKSESEAASKEARKAAKAGLNIQSIAAQVTAEEEAIATAQAANDAQDYAAAKDQFTLLKDEIAQLQASLEAAGFTAAL